MEHKLSDNAPLTDPEVVAQPKAPPPHESAVSSPEPDLRLVIEESPQSGSFVYKTVDRRTGEVVLQLPREEVLRLRDVQDYVAGDVITTQA
jgi:flagellar protein FlaG